MAVNITDRSAVEALIREQIVSTIFQDAPKQSAFMGMARKLPNMTSKQTRIRVLDFLPTAYWVDGDTGMKQVRFLFIKLDAIIHHGAHLTVIGEIEIHKGGILIQRKWPRNRPPS